MKNNIINKISISELFLSMQGEGPLIGEPAIFIRTYGCPEPRCKFCDSKYSWQTSKDIDVKHYNVNELFKKIKKIIKDNKLKYKPLIVITGGEPLLQGESLIEFGEKLVENGYDIQYETSGKIDIKYLPFGTIVCSPKQYNGKFLIKKHIIKLADFFKFVVETESELNNILNFIKKYKINKDDCYLMPKGTTQNKQLKIMKRIEKMCIKHGIKIAPRLHILIHDNKRGV